MNNGTFHYVASQLAQGAADVFMLQESHNDQRQNLKWRARFRRLKMDAYFLNATTTITDKMTNIRTNARSNANTGGLMIVCRQGLDVLERQAYRIDEYAHCIFVRLKQSTVCLINAYILSNCQATALRTLQSLSSYTRDLNAMWAIYADWNMTPSQFSELGLDLSTRGEVMAPPDDTYTCSSGGQRVIDWALQSKGYASLLSGFWLLTRATGGAIVALMVIYPVILHLNEFVNAFVMNAFLAFLISIFYTVPFINS